MKRTLGDVSGAKQSRRKEKKHQPRRRDITEEKSQVFPLQFLFPLGLCREGKRFTAVKVGGVGSESDL